MFPLLVGKVIISHAILSYLYTVEQIVLLTEKLITTISVPGLRPRGALLVPGDRIRNLYFRPYCVLDTAHDSQGADQPIRSVENVICDIVPRSVLYTARQKCLIVRQSNEQLYTRLRFTATSTTKLKTVR